MLRQRQQKNGTPPHPWVVLTAASSVIGAMIQIAHLILK